MNTKTLNTELTELAEKQAKEQAQLILKHNAAQLTGIDIDNIIVYNDNTIGFGWRNPLTKDDIKKIVLHYPINGNNHELKFADSSKNFISDSPVVVKWTNWETITDHKLDICYPSNDVKIKISVAPSFFGSHVYYVNKQGNHLGFGRYENKRLMYIDYFYTVKYSGGSCVLHFLQGAGKQTEYENFILTGVFQYQDEL